MKWKSYAIWGLCAALLVLTLGTRRAAIDWETVDDEVIPASGPIEEPYVITFGVPDDATMEPLSAHDRGLYVAENGDYEVYSDVIAAPNLDQALKAVSGFGEDELDVVETTRFGLPEYRFAWASASDEGGRVSRAALVEDENYFYALVFSVKEGLGTKYDEEAEAVFSSFGLYGDEMF